MTGRFIKMDNHLCAIKMGPSYKLLLALIESLENGQGCYASNAYLSMHMGLSESSISDMIGKLRKGGYLRTGHVYKPNSPKDILDVDVLAPEAMALMNYDGQLVTVSSDYIGTVGGNYIFLQWCKKTPLAV